MKKLSLGILIGVAIFVFAGIARGIVFVPAIVVPSGVTVSVPDVAVDKAQALVPLEPGSLERTIFIHYANGKVVVKGKAPACYKLLGVQWKSLPISYVINPNVESIVPGAISVSNETWDIATSRELFNDTPFFDSSADWDSDYPDGRNEYSLGNYPQKGVIAVTVIWSGVPLGGRGRQIVDYDVMFDTDYAWGDASINPAVMDLQNIATHESGHGLGLADIYDSVCSAVTMYGYSSYGETQKRILEQPDITGLQKLYGY